MSSTLGGRVVSGQAIRACAAAVIDAVSRHDGDTKAITEAIMPSFRVLLARPDLLNIGVPRPGNHVALSWYLYYDADLSLLIYPLAKNKVVPAHDHGNWESMFIYRGAVEHTVYERTDNGAIPGHADLRVFEHRVLRTGDSAVLAPPADIHTFRAVENDTYAITVASGMYKEERCYFQPDTGTYIIKNPRTA